jgi:hypothetical protein
MMRDIHFEGPTAELLIPISAANALPSGNVLFVMNICPQWLYATRLRYFARLYGQYRFTKFSVEIIPSSPTTFGGSICYAIDKDVDSNLNLPGSSELAYAMAIDSSFTGPIWQAATLSADCTPKSQRLVNYLCDSEAELSQAVQFRVLGVVANTLSGTGPYGILLRMAYTIEFTAPLLDFLTTLPTAFQTGQGASISLNSSGILGVTGGSPAWVFPAGPLNSMGNPTTGYNGLVCAVNPIIANVSNAGALPVGAVIINCKTDFTGGQFLAFPTVAACMGSLSSNTSTGSVLGPGTNVTMNTPISFFPVAYVALGNHT